MGLAHCGHALLATMMLWQGCLSTDVEDCGAQVCPSSLRCDMARSQCVPPEAFDACASKAPYAGCSFRGVLNGLCHEEVCVPVSCPDGAISEEEPCDDDNDVAGDGCSATCQIELPPSWAQLDESVTGPARHRHAMAFDSGRNRLVLFGGLNSENEFAGDETWEWDGERWTALTSPNHPEPRYDHAMAYDAGRGKVVLFGGLHESTTEDNDTWEWDGEDWIEVQVPAEERPAPRIGHAMVYAPALGQIVLFGGLDSGELREDTWLYDGSTWIRLPGSSPPLRAGHAMASDFARARVVLFGGFNLSATALDDTWEWDGQSWSEVATPPASRPVGRQGHAMGFDAAHGVVVLFAGRSEYSQLADTWEWDGSSWTEPNVVGSPAPRVEHAMAFSGSGLLVHGGRIQHNGEPAVTIYDTMQWRNPYEACATGVDGDGDGLAGCQDPDCWPLCAPSCPPRAPCDPNAPHCGDGSCGEAIETSQLCPSDCDGAVCGDLVCQPSESPTGCPGDCGAG